MIALAAAGCGQKDRPPRSAASAAMNQARPGAAVSTVGLVLPASSALATSDSPATPLSPSARRGLALLAATSDSLPGFVGARMRCFSCHLDAGRRPNAMPLLGTYARLPKYQARTGRVITIQNRVNACFTRSLAGRVIPEDGRDMVDIVAYLRLISIGSSAAHVAGVGLRSMPAMPTTDTARGRVAYTAHCARCHGTDGAGVPPASPLWGTRSFSIGASLARLERAASFIRYNMPYDSAGTLDDGMAYNIAAYIESKPRPDTRGKTHDWPNGDAPWDVPYRTRNHLAFQPPRLLLPPAR